MSLRNVGIVDLGINNISSLRRAILRLDSSLSVKDVRRDSDLDRLDLIFLPGVGNFGAATRSMETFGLNKSIHQFTNSGKPLIAICLGMHLLFGSSEESPESKGLSILEGTVNRLPATPGNPVPNVGWGEVDFLYTKISIFENSRDFYFTHSFYVEPTNSSSTLCVSEHGNFKFASGVMERNVMGFQFHPEKSGEVGLALLKWALGWAREID